jgi:hypothetical protein
MTAADTPAGLIALATQLAELLERETALVRAMKVAEIGPLQGEKSRLTMLFDALIRTGGKTAAFSGTLKTQWLAAAKRLGEAAEENERALRAGRTATERLVSAIVKAVKETRRPTSAYTARHAAPRREPAVAGIALDHRL